MPVTFQNNATLSTLTTSINSSPWLITTTDTTMYPYNWGTTTTISSPYTGETIFDPLKNLNYIVDFDHSIDRFDLLEDNIKGIRKNKFLFWCKYEGNRIQPYELIMRLIREKTKFTVTVDVSDILSIKYTNVQFVEIENNLNFNTECDFSELKVKFKYENIKYENHKLSIKELRIDKLKKLKETQE